MSTRERIIKMAHALNEINRISGHQNLYELMQYLIKTNRENHDIEMAITINIDKNPRNFIELFLSNLKIEIIAIKKDEICLTQDLKTIF